MSVSIGEDGALTCCASRRFAGLVAASGPHTSSDALIDKARHIWWHQLGVLDWLEAFAAHPTIGDSHGTEGKPAAFVAFSLEEQAAAQHSTSGDVAALLQELNRRYLAKFGFIFIICAKGRPAPDILRALEERFQRLPDAELHTAASEQMKITEMRLRALLQPQQAAAEAAAAKTAAAEAVRRTAQLRADKVLGHLVPPTPPSPALRSPITTHVLDTATGKPAEGMLLQLLKQDDGHSAGWAKLSEGTTNSDGRVGNLLPPSDTLQPGRYRMVFHTGPYLVNLSQRHPGLVGSQPFYPEVVVDFVITPESAREHYHIPLLLSPYSFSTYKGS